MPTFPGLISAQASAAGTPAFALVPKATLNTRGLSQWACGAKRNSNEQVGRDAWKRTSGVLLPASQEEVFVLPTTALADFKASSRLGMEREYLKGEDHDEVGTSPWPGSALTAPNAGWCATRAFLIYWTLRLEVRRLWACVRIVPIMLVVGRERVADWTDLQSVGFNHSPTCPSLRLQAHAFLAP